MNKLLSFLDGKKTVLGIIAGVLYSLSIYFFKVESNDLVWTTIAGWTGISARLAIKKIQ